ncbi:putative uncharacterized protein DDB_G0286901 [Microplitis demolitor]|uniref:putative uncharacterized protein DDB_G0286901 n=1 Tax=Microplitis demolitor TaxID=69319 RepID=UPI00235B652E|nr:putative uncharacterized protein DDB_G0286901 [Microplitis demolitor]
MRLLDFITDIFYLLYSEKQDFCIADLKPASKYNYGSNIIYNYAVSTNLKNVENKRLIFQTSSTSSPQTSNTNNISIQRSFSADNVIKTRGFKPSDRHDPVKRNFLENLTSKILHFDMDSGQKTLPINLQKLLTPAMDSVDLQTRHKKMYASSCFYGPTHPTVEDQVELARRISYSLSDVKNMKSKGQSMYVNRKKRSVKWIHDGNGAEGEEEPQSPVHKDKVPLKCVMNPNGKVMDITGIQALGEEPNIGTSPINAEKLFDIVRDLNNQKGRGAEIFAKRRKRSEKWVVDKDQSSTPSTPNYSKVPPNFSSNMDYGTNENSNFTNNSPLSTPAFQNNNNNNNNNHNSKPFFNPFAMDFSLDNTIPSTFNFSEHESRRKPTENILRKPAEPEIKKIYLREVAVGTDSDLTNGKHMNNNHHHHQNHNNHNNHNNNNNNNGYEKYRMPESDRYQSHPQSRRKAQAQYHQNDYREVRDTRNSDRNYDNRNNNHNNDTREHHRSQRQQHKQQKHQQLEEEQEYEDENDYTPVPVKQLIQEFEKTCRPVFQYKQMSPKVTIVQQHPPLDDISRFFDAPRMPANKQINNNNNTPMNGVNGNGNQIAMNGNQVGINGNHLMINENQMGMNGNHLVMNGNQMVGNGNGYQRTYPKIGYQSMGGNGLRYEYDSSDDEIDDSFGESSESMDNLNIDDYDGGGVRNGSRYSNGTRISDPISNRMSGMSNSRMSGMSNRMSSSDCDYRRQLFDAATDQLFEAPAGFRNEDMDSINKFIDTEAEIPIQMKSLILKGITSQEDILEQIKLLRRTPVLENLIPGPPIDSKMPSLGAKLYESTYSGPKIASVQTLANYNTAPRGWDQSQSFYRPVTFDKPQEPITYSDF